MDPLLQEIAQFRQRKEAERAKARQCAALRLACGIDLPDLVGADRGTLLSALARIGRAMQRERLKALRKHWSYDLDRHIALKQAGDELRRSLGMADVANASSRSRHENGASRRRRQPPMDSAA